MLNEKCTAKDIAVVLVLCNNKVGVSSNPSDTFFGIPAPTHTGVPHNPASVPQPSECVVPKQGSGAVGPAQA